MVELRISVLNSVVSWVTTISIWGERRNSNRRIMITLLLVRVRICFLLESLIPHAVFTKSYVILQITAVVNSVMNRSSILEMVSCTYH